MMMVMSVIWRWLFLLEGGACINVAIDVVSRIVFDGFRSSITDY